jgi:hypothetical protein
VFDTVMDAVPGFETLAAGILAFRRLVDSTVVSKGDPFQFTTAVGANPVPFTVMVKALLPGFALGGTRGWSTSGTGFWANTVAVTKSATHQSEANFIPSSADIAWPIRSNRMRVRLSW